MRAGKGRKEEKLEAYTRLLFLRASHNSVLSTVLFPCYIKVIRIAKTNIYGMRYESK